jgi:membrane protease YdiL (CAAX protease family)
VSLVPLTRLLSLVMPIRAVGLTFTDPTFAYIAVGSIGLIGVLVVARALRATRVLFRPGRRVWAQPLIALTGVPIGIGLAAAGAAGPLAYADDPVVFVVSMVVFVALFEELLFRGLLQRVASERSAVIGIVLPNALYAILYLATGVPILIGAVSLMGLFFSLCVHQTRSLWGVISAHAIARVIVGL